MDSLDMRDALFIAVCVCELSTQGCQLVPISALWDAYKDSLIFLSSNGILNWQGAAGSVVVAAKLAHTASKTRKVENKKLFLRSYSCSTNLACLIHPLSSSTVD